MLNKGRAVGGKRQEERSEQDESSKQSCLELEGATLEGRGGGGGSGCTNGSLRNGCLQQVHLSHPNMLYFYVCK